MADYRVYVIGIDGRYVRSIMLDCPDDNAAMESAKQFVDGHDIELWRRDRPIARFDRNPQDPRGWLKGELRPPD